MSITVAANQQPTPSIPQIVAQKRGVAIVNVAVTLASTVAPVDGSYWVSGWIKILSGATYNFGLVVSFTDENGNAGTRSIPLMIGGIVVVAQNADGNPASYSGMGIQIRVKAGTTVSVTPTGTFTNVTYNAEAQITKLSD